jgi:hypothetical protein
MSFAINRAMIKKFSARSELVGRDAVIDWQRTTVSITADRSDGSANGTYRLVFG